nr:hypothetical protein [Tessaracoccus timonensis]
MADVLLEVLKVPLIETLALAKTAPTSLSAPAVTENDAVPE